MSIISFAPDVRSLLAKRGAYSGTDCTMKKIELTQGKYAMVDDEDYKIISNYKWYSKFMGLWYASTNRRTSGKKRTSLLMHRFILGAERGQVVDHIDGNGLNNRRENLRIVSASENQRNQKRHREGSPVGITLHKSGKYQAQARSGKKVIYLGLFDDEKEASKAFSEYEHNCMV